MMEEEWMRDRARLRDVLMRYPDWRVQDYAQAVGRSISWVKKWRKRLRQADPHDLQVLLSRSRAHHAPYPSWDPRVEERIVEMRQTPPEHLHRVPGPRALLYYLQRDPELQALHVLLPRSTRTVWKMLHKHGCILEHLTPKKQPLESRAPLEEIQMDFKDVSTVPSSESQEGKRQHIVEVCNFIDAGTSVLLCAQAREDFHAQTAMQTVIGFLREHGRPPMMSFDRDPRWVGSSSGRDFPSALRRLLLCLGIQPNVCPPHRPDKNAFVERYHKSYGQECLHVQRPGTLQEVREVTEAFIQHYNWERPHQGCACRNVPPRVAFPTLPTLPALPQMVDPDAWLQAIEGQIFVRKVGADGCVNVDLAPYYISQQVAGQYMALQVVASERTFLVWHGPTMLKTVPIKHLYGQQMPLEDYFALMMQEALAEERRLSASERHFRQLALW
ncbi:integrase core domain-containing protein [Ktedonobacter racemifer]|uniref:Integrase catalytic region n=1 Tax=Ktedonobacter racemifer DSM 44963 TaxID=485913 RepID=D6TC07_KTERA|nr:integrase core domain-containing protein [Ktedonobacter racemifer]EFH88043.1 Integrase catalytic region [Ktedonobacter racemifer DSM 44963]